MITGGRYKFVQSEDMRSKISSKYADNKSNVYACLKQLKFFHIQYCKAF